MTEENYTFTLGLSHSDNKLEMNVRVLKNKVKFTHGPALIYQFKRTESGAILKPENISYSRRLHEHLDDSFGIVKREVRVAGVRLTCPCDSPEIRFIRDWSDGMSQSYTYECRNCDTGTSVSKNYKDVITSTGNFERVE